MISGNTTPRTPYSDDQLSWEDSERFEEDESLCSWSSGLGSWSVNFRGWEQSNGDAGRMAAANSAIADMDLTNRPATMTDHSSAAGSAVVPKKRKNCVESLLEISARVVATAIPFEVIEHHRTPVPELLQQRIAFYSFPEDEEDIRLYSCLANGSVDEFAKGKALYLAKAVLEIVQIGFHLNAVVEVTPATCAARSDVTPTFLAFGTHGFELSRFYVTVTLDRRRITSCTCSCPVRYWCQHVVAACLYRILLANSVPLRAPVSESLSHLNRAQLQKFAQHLITQLPKHVVPTAQKLLDELLDPKSRINEECGAPDVTAGASVDDVAAWCLHERSLKHIVHKLLGKYCSPSPVVLSDVNFLTSSAPAVAAEFQAFQRTLRGREPEGLWNLLSIVREMFRRRDNNAVKLLRIVTAGCLERSHVVQWWYVTKVLQVNVRSAVTPLSSTFIASMYNACPIKPKCNVGGQMFTAKYSCSLLMDEIVYLWRIAALNPAMTSFDRRALAQELLQFHNQTLVHLDPAKCKAEAEGSCQQALVANAELLPVDYGSAADLVGDHLQWFLGFKEAYQMCFVDWSDSGLLQLPTPMANVGIWDGVVSTADCPVMRNRPSVGSWCKRDGSKMRDAGSAEWKLNQVGRDDSLPLYPTPFHQATTSKNVKGKFGQESANPILLTDELVSDEGDDVAVMDGFEMKDMLEVIAQPACSQKVMAEEESSVAGSSIMKGMKTPMDANRIRLARCEALYTHGYVDVARQLASTIAEDMLNYPPNLLFDIPAALGNRKQTWASQQNRGNCGRKKKRVVEVIQMVNPKALEASNFICEMLVSVGFLLDVLVNDGHHEPVAFRLGLLVLSLPRNAAASKFLEVQTNFLEVEIVNKMKRMLLNEEEMEEVRRQGRDLVMATRERRWGCVMPVSLAIYITHCLLPMAGRKKNPFRKPSDSLLGFDVALAALAMKTTIPEAEHPLLYECVRRQRGELTLEILLHYKEDADHLAKILDTLLDREVHQMHHRPRETNVSHLGRVTDANPTNYGQTAKADPPGVQNAEADQPGTSSSACTEGAADLEAAAEPKRLMAVDSSVAGPTARFFSSCAMMEECGRMAVQAGSSLPSESQVHYMMELAKRLAGEAGVSHLTAVFTNPDGIANQLHVTHRALHLCAFQIGLYALGLHNKLSSNWLSRTYSSFVSWISCQAMEIGRSAINILMDTWENHLTPSEAATLADKASQSRDPAMVEVAAKLALSVLPHAHALNPTEIQRALAQCKEQNTEMLQQACMAVEKAGSAEAVYPEVLFQVAQQWYQLYLDVLGQSRADSVCSLSPAVVNNRSVVASGSWIDGGPVLASKVQPSSPTPYMNPIFPMDVNRAHLPQEYVNVWGRMVSHSTYASQMPPAPPPTQSIVQPLFSFSGPVSMSIGFSTLNGQMAQSGPSAAIQPAYCGFAHPAAAPCVPQNPSFWTTPAGPVYGSLCFASNAPNVAVPSVINAQEYPTAYVSPYVNVGQVQHVQMTQPLFHNVQQQQQQGPRAERQTDEPELSVQDNSLAGQYLQNACRVGFLAMETMGRRNSDERSFNKFSQNPPYGDDVKWLLLFAKKLGINWVYTFCTLATKAVASPFVLWDLFLDVANYLGRIGGAGGTSVPESASATVPISIGPNVLNTATGSCVYSAQTGPPTMVFKWGVNTQAITEALGHGSVLSLLRSCHDMFFTAAVQKLSHPRFVQADADELINLVRNAQEAFAVLPNGQGRFTEFMQALKRQKACKKDLWLQLVTAVNYK